MSPKEFEAAMQNIADNPDEESRHSEADELMMTALKQCGYEKGIEIFDGMLKWYA